jgi:hypothetical protein
MDMVLVIFNVICQRIGAALFISDTFSLKLAKIKDMHVVAHQGIVAFMNGSVLIFYLRYIFCLQFWETISKEHGIDRTGLYCGDSNHQFERISANYCKTDYENYVPHSIFADTGPYSRNSVLMGPFGQIFQPSNVLSGDTNACNNWAMSYNNEGAVLAHSVMDAIRREAERCGHVHCFQLIHSWVRAWAVC